VGNNLDLSSLGKREEYLWRRRRGRGGEWSRSGGGGEGEEWMRRRRKWRRGSG
jgi:hypothetical protein